MGYTPYTNTEEFNRYYILDEVTVNGETHLLFFDNNKEKFGDSQVGDVVEFVVSGNKYYEKPRGDGLDKTRNIYTDKKIRIPNR